MELNLPKLIFADDYHAFDDYQSAMKTIFGKNYPKIYEIGFSYNTGNYVAIVYEGKKPTNEILNKLLAENNVEIE